MPSLVDTNNEHTHKLMFVRKPILAYVHNCALTSHAQSLVSCGDVQPTLISDISDKH